MRCNRRYGTNGQRSKFVLILLLFLMPAVHGCAQGELEQLVSDIKKFYLNGGFTNLTDPVEQPGAPETASVDKTGATDGGTAMPEPGTPKTPDGVSGTR